LAENPAGHTKEEEEPVWLGHRDCRSPAVGQVNSSQVTAPESEVNPRLQGIGEMVAIEGQIDPAGHNLHIPALILSL
jgi:hypothetical protein